MCGIAGIVHLDGSPAGEERDGAFLKAAAARLAPRGPDDERFFFWGPVGLAFRRLSIVDLRGGRQPLANDDGSILHVTNGEIYNHRELRAGLLAGRTLPSESDCAVIPYLYEKLGRDYLRELNGMFATALLDRRGRKLLLARDRLGIKPLYLYRDRSRLVFGSEIKAVLAHEDVPRRFDWGRALSYTKERYQPEPDKPLLSFFEGIEYVPGGTVVTIDLDAGTSRDHRYWSFEALASEPPDENRTAEDFIEEYGSLLADSVRLRLMADVEYGLFLSGGIDSVAIAALASRHASSFHTFSVLSQSTITSGDAPSAHRAARSLGLSNHHVLFDWRTLRVTPEDWKRVLFACETPEAGAEQLYKYNLHATARFARPALKVMLVGQGSDELNGGYSKLWVEPDGDASPETGWRRLQAAFLRQQRASLLRRAAADSLYEEVVPASELSDASSLRRRADGIVDGRFLSARAGQPFEAEGWHIYRSVHRYNLEMFNLWHEDRTAAAHGIENRVPFLDHRLVELTLRVPPRLYRELYWDKAILRRAMSGTVPDELRAREKVPFFVGDDLRYTRRMMYQMLRADGDALLREGLEGSRLAGGVLDEDYVRRVTDELPRDPEYASVDALLELVNMGLLEKMAREQPPAATPTARPLVAEVSIEDWDEWLDRHGVELVRRRVELSDASVPRFAEGVLLARCEAGDPGWMDEGGYYVLVDNELRFVIEADNRPWIEFLLGVDGERTVAEILDSARLDRAAVWKHLEEAVELGVLALGAGHRWTPSS